VGKRFPSVYEWRIRYRRLPVAGVERGCVEELESFRLSSSVVVNSRDARY